MENKPDQEIRYRLHAIMIGRVQGVGFRYFVIECATALNLVGWVRNTYDGNVEVTAEGSHPALTRFLSYLQTGPPSSFIEKVEDTWQEADDSKAFSSFRIRATTWD